jgi:multisubunit Na+/H+ antiporter MnhC subunit
MNTEVLQIFWPFGISIIILCIIGIYCTLVTYNLIRALIGIELLLKAVTLLIITVGYITHHSALAQALVITFIVIEVVVMTVAIGVVLGIRSHNNSLDTRGIRNLKG